MSADPPAGPAPPPAPAQPTEPTQPAQPAQPTRPADPTQLVDLDALAGNSVRLRALNEGDLPQLCAWWADPRITPYQVVGPPHPRPASVLAEWFRTRGANDGMDCGFCIVTKDSGELVGQAALFGIAPKDRCATLGIFLGPEHQGRGYGSDAVRTLVRYGFAQLNLHRVELGVFGFNAHAIATYRKVGFVEEGRRRQAIYRSGAWHDEVRMSILRSEWDASSIP
ncbi:GNAT family protein [Actinopolymorpha sp. B11F2]|uniref:GNAT family N-acetyltransferase n=1 Tax=Actinopolymorpha sp. B11F2 TaxID=3160862 RepID=UPI0032E3D471